jgi:small subunit ribosomal protein S15e
LDKSQKELLQLLTCRIRRRFARGIPRAYNTLLKKLRKAKKATAAYDKPATVKTHLRNMPIIPEMIGSVVGVYNGQFFINVEIKVCCSFHQENGRFFCLDFVGVAVPFPELHSHTFLQAEMVGHYLAEFAMTYKPTRHGRPGVGGNKFVPLK